MTNNKSNSIIKYLYFAVSVALFLMLASRSSFLYTFNNWDDANSYFTMGKALFNGKMLYRDVFDQKGMYLYFLYGLAYLCSHTTFLGVYLLEVVLGFIDVLFFYKTIRLFAGDKFSTVVAPLTYAVIVSSRSFWWGGAAEEIYLPFMVIGLYLFARYFESDYSKKVMPLRTVFAGGILAGIVANTKFTGLGFYFAWMMLVFFAYLVHKDLAGGIKACLVFLLGMFIPFIPWIIYFGVNNGLYEWYWGYVYVNVFVYPTTGAGESTTIFSKCYDLAKLLYILIQDNIGYFSFAIAGFIYTLLKGKRKMFTRISYVILFGFLYLGIFVGGRNLPYYSIPLSMFAVFGMAFLAQILEKILKDVRPGFYAGAITLMLSMIFIRFSSMNVPFMEESRDLFLYRFRDEVNTTENPTLLNVGCLDAGLYTLCDIVPNCRWFQTQTLDIEDDANNPYKEQARYIREGLVDYVLVRDDIPDNINDHYELIDQEKYGWGDYMFDYYLYRKVF